MNTVRFYAVLIILFPTAWLGLVPDTKAADDPSDNKSEDIDSYYYYGPGKLWKQWNYNPEPNDQESAAVKVKREKARLQRLGRDTWIHWTWGNQKVIRSATVLAGHLPVPVSIDFFRLLDSHNRATRFRDFGLINEPNCGRRKKNEPDYDEHILKTYGLYIDKWNGDPYGYYPMSKKYRKEYGKDLPKPKEGYEQYYPLKYPGTAAEEADLYRHYGRPSGIVGLRLFDNPAFKGKETEWDLAKYFRNPGKVEPPFLVGFTCGLCHVAFDPLNPPKDPEHPRWDNLAANIGNQYFREGELMLGKGRIAFGDKHPDPAFPGDPYKTRGLTDEDFLYHYAATQQPGTSETSRLSYDFINNPNTINPIYGLAYRPFSTETTSWGKKLKEGKAWHILKDGADSVGIDWALMRVPINIGCEGDYWIDRLYRPGREQRPFRIAEVLAGLEEHKLRDAYKRLGIPSDPATIKQMKLRLAELRTRYLSPYGDEPFGYDWQEAWKRIPALKAYLLSYESAHLQDVVKTANPKDVEAAKEAAPQEEKRTHGAVVFGRACASCHSSKRPLPGKSDERKVAFLRWSPTAPEFLSENFLSDDRRYRVTDKELGTNMARALATNAVDHDVWAEFSSKEYKALPSIALLTPLLFQVPVFPTDPKRPLQAPPPLRVEFDPPAGGRGYYRTPSLISVWATAPYLHNNSVGDYWVITDKGEKKQFPNDGTRIGYKREDGSWVDYQIDVSVQGRLNMFKDGMDKLLNPAKRRRWVKRTAVESVLLPDLATSVRELVASVAHDVLRHELDTWMKQNQFVPAFIDQAIQIVEASLDRALRDVLSDAEASVRFAWSAAHLRARDHADRLFDLTFDDLKASLKDKPHADKLPLDRLKLSLRREFLGRLDRLDRQLREAALLKVPKGWPINLYANLGPGKLPYALLAHIRYRDDPPALIQALLEMSTCPDLVEDHGHTYGEDLSDDDKADLIEFLKTF